MPDGRVLKLVPRAWGVAVAGACARQPRPALVLAWSGHALGTVPRACAGRPRLQVGTLFECLEEVAEGAEGETDGGVAIL